MRTATRSRARESRRRTSWTRRSAPRMAPSSTTTSPCSCRASRPQLPSSSGFATRATAAASSTRAAGPPCPRTSSSLLRRLRLRRARMRSESRRTKRRARWRCSTKARARAGSKRPSMGASCLIAPRTNSCSKRSRPSGRRTSARACKTRSLSPARQRASSPSGCEARQFRKPDCIVYCMTCDAPETISAYPRGYRRAFV
mmetsp:Transcript_27040/g.86035  ORF Transcript_27040/g.86035 Transcript_27040/m.86035 type:complete len:200 (+) Transcript_27040:384-983(+)